MVEVFITLCNGISVTKDYFKDNRTGTYEKYKNIEEKEVLQLLSEKGPQTISSIYLRNISKEIIEELKEDDIIISKYKSFPNYSIIYYNSRILMLLHFFLIFSLYFLLGIMILNLVTIGSFLEMKILFNVYLLFLGSVLFHELGHILIYWVLHPASKFYNGYIKFNKFTISFNYNSNFSWKIVLVSLSGSFFAIMFLILAKNMLGIPIFITIFIGLYHLFMLLPFQADGMAIMSSLRK